MFLSVSKVMCDNFGFSLQRDEILQVETSAKSNQNALVIFFFTSFCILLFYFIVFLYCVILGWVSFSHGFFVKV